jgi:nucleolar MIF4G domain-containing protein 1
VQNAVALYERHYQTLQSDAVAVDADVETMGKECSNLIVLLSELYNFQVISSVLLFDIIKSLLSSELTETHVELLLKLVRSMNIQLTQPDQELTHPPDSGQQLRQDDPLALKDIIQIVQDKVTDHQDALR